MRTKVLLISTIVVACLPGCMTTDNNPKWDPRAELPGWTYDAPFYYRPTNELEPLETVGDGIPVYYTRDDAFFILHPGNYQPAGVPRVGVWYSTTQGSQWHRAGYFGLEQSHFLFQAGEDAEYWIRFVGPGQPPAIEPMGSPHRIYMVDTKPPAISLSISPPYLPNGKAAPDAEYWMAKPFEIGDELVVSWGICDGNFLEKSVELLVVGAEFPKNLPLARLDAELSDAGSMLITIPPHSADAGQIMFAIRACDKAGNVSMATTPALTIAPPAEGVSYIPAQANGWMTYIPPQSDRSGWPTAGQFVRGGTEQVLNWLCPAAGDYQDVQLEFSARDGRDRTWQKMAKDLKTGQPVKWMAPRISSRSCRLRIIAMLSEPPGKDEPPYVVLAISPRFTVDTPGSDDTVVMDVDVPD